MSNIELTLGNDERFNEVTEKTFVAEHLEIITKDFGDLSNAPEAVIAFGFLMPDGTPARARVVTTVEFLSEALSAIEGRYGVNNRKRRGW